MKPIIHKIGLAIAAFATSLSAYAYDFMADGIAYNVVSASDFTCATTQSDEKYKGDIVVPSSVKFNGRTLTVVALGASSFEECTELKSIIIPESVTSLETYCFSGCISLTSIGIPESVTWLGSSCFSDCRGLTSIVIPESVTGLGNGCFSGCTSLTSIEIPKSVTRLGDFCFSCCSGLTSIVIPESVTGLGYKCFYDCSGLTSIEIPKSVTQLGDFCFSDCSGLTSINIMAPKMFVGGSCFANCEHLESVQLTIDRLEKTSFSNCPNITDVYINCPNLGNLGGYAFDSSSKISRLTIGPNVKESVLLNEYSYYTPVDLIIEDSEEAMEFGYNNGGFINRVFPKSWSKIENLYLGRPIENILKCPSLKTLTLGKLFTNLMIEDRDGFDYSFSIDECSTLTTLRSLNPEPPGLGYTTESQYATLEVQVPAEFLDAYKSHPVWGKFWNLKGIENAGMDDIQLSDKIVSARYDLMGRPVDETFRGIVIERYSDGTTQKVIR